MMNWCFGLLLLLNLYGFLKYHPRVQTIVV
uniref:Uncharacterized protein n=1 Tax=Arundo donax TaxID=35708 RepID=A0A0A8ZSD7_ARUDO